MSKGPATFSLSALPGNRTLRPQLSQQNALIIKPSLTTALPHTLPANFGRWLPALVLTLVVLTLIAFPLQILSDGFLPPDDALRHAAKVISGKSWPEILIMRPEFSLDHNPGWHHILAVIHHVTGWDTRGLVQISVSGMFLVFALTPLIWTKRSEAWLAALLVVMLVFPYFAERAMVGRPLFVTMAVTLALLCLWQRSSDGRISWKRVSLSTVLMSLSVWVHGSWYLLVLIPGVFFLAQEWRKGVQLAGCWAVACVLGALPTGHPVAFLKQAALIPLMALGQGAPVRSLVGEFQPFSGSYPALIVVGVVLIWRKMTARSLIVLLRDPVFWMGMLGLVLGFRVLRFWLDWGIPTLALWLAGQIQEFLETSMAPHKLARLALAGLLGIVMMATVASDRGARWSQYGAFEALDAARPEHAAWLPAAGGILYSVDLAVFYETFFQNPLGTWRYVLGFEPSFMRPEDLAVYQELWRTLNAVKACAPWVARMTTADRLVLRSPSQNKPAILGLEWQYVVTNTWVGRLPQTEPR